MLSCRMCLVVGVLEPRTMRDYLSGRLARDLLRNEYVLEDTSCVVTDGAAYATENIWFQHCGTFESCHKINNYLFLLVSWYAPFYQFRCNLKKHNGQIWKKIFVFLECIGICFRNRYNNYSTIDDSNFYKLPPTYIMTFNWVQNKREISF